MKVVFLNATGQLGGAERVLVCLLRALRSEVPDWSLQVIVGDDGPLIPLLTGLGFAVELLQIPQRLINFGEASSRNPLALLCALVAGLRYRKQLRGALFKHSPDITHTINFKMHLLASCARVPGSALCWHIHDFVSNRKLTRMLLRLLSLRPDHIVAISESVARDMRAVSQAPERVRTVLNAVEIHHFTPAGPMWPVGSDLSIGFIATFAYWKGHEVFLRAVASLPFSVRAYIVGGPVYKTAGSQISIEEIQALVQSLGLDGRVIFTGFLEDTAPLLRSLDLLVHASTEPEPFGLTIAEGMSCGRAVVASLAGGVPEFLVPGENGLGHSPGDVAGLAHAMELLLSDPELRKRYGRAARETALSKLNPVRMAREFIEIYSGR
jgi:glycosyltransferase involved in cell wall biosynthesis